MILKDNGRERLLGIPTVKDRIVQATVKRIMEPIFEKIFCDCSFGFRPGRSQIDAINKVEKYRDQGYKIVRFADDFVILTKSKKKAKRALEVVKEMAEKKFKLTLHPEKTVWKRFYISSI